MNKKNNTFRKYTSHKNESISPSNKKLKQKVPKDIWNGGGLLCNYIVSLVTKIADDHYTIHL